MWMRMRMRMRMRMQMPKLKPRAMSLMVLLAVAALWTVDGIGAIQCEDGYGYGYGSDYEILCESRNDSAFLVKGQPGEYVQVDCRNRPDWSDLFRLTDSCGSFGSSTGQSKRLYFRMCALPGNGSLGDIARHLGAEGVEQLSFQSFGNLSNSLTKRHLGELPGLKKLTLSSNGLFRIDSELLAGLPELAWLDLRNNDVQELTPGMLEHTPKLETLELGDNAITAVRAGTLANLRKLRLLNVWKNQLRQIEPGSLDRLESLQSLDLHSNQLTTLPEKVFRKLANLETLSLFGNNFTALPESLLLDLTRLATVNLYNNKAELTLPRGFFANLTSLRTVRLRRNHLRSLPEDLFWGAISLANVSLERNYLVTLPRRIFRDSVNLTNLDLHFNDLEHLPDGVFTGTTGLVRLNLAKNRLTAISGDLFKGLVRLEELNVEDNRLTTIHDSSFSTLQNLKIARFSNNRLTLKPGVFHYQDEYGTKSPFHRCELLQELYLEGNNISEIFSDWLVSSVNLRVLDLKRNNLSYVTIEDFQFVSNDIKVDLTRNNISRILMGGAENVASNQRTPRGVIVLLDNNPLTCDCTLYEFVRYLEGSMHPYVQNYVHVVPGNLTCSRPAELAGTAVARLRAESLTCPIDHQSAEDGAECLERCACAVRPNDKAYLIDCSDRNLTTERRERESSEDGRGPIKVPPGHHVELNYAGNRLTRIPSLRRLASSNVTALRLSGNDISDVELDELPATLTALQLDNNNLTGIRADVLARLANSTRLAKLTLHNNPWRCDCDARDLVEFVRSKVLDVPQLARVNCNGLDRPMTKMSVNEYCPEESATTIVAASLTVAFTGLLIGAIAALYYRYQREIKVWMYAHQCCLWLVTEDELDRDKLYDAFLSYSHKDERFVVDELVARLEAGPRPFKLCIHFRDWLAGEWIPAQIARSVEQSRRTIVVVSPNFLESVWGRMEFRAAHTQALAEGRARVILILYGEIGPTANLDPELRTYLSTNTYVKWGDPWFWDKLRYALPHPPEFTKDAAAVRRKIFQRHQPSIRINAEKKELVYPNGGAALPDFPATPPVTTPPADTLKPFLHQQFAVPAEQPSKPATGIEKTPFVTQCTTV